jgi:hypothetical protein
MTRWLTASIAFLSTGCTLGNHHLTSEDRALTGFSRLENASGVTVAVTEGSDAAVAVTIDSNLQSRLLTEIQGDKLVIRSQGAILPSGGSLVTVQMPYLTAAVSSGSGQISIKGVETPHDLSLSSEGSGSMQYEGTTDALSLLVTGSGAIKLSGSGAALAAKVSGSGTLEAAGFPVTSAVLENDGSGSMTAQVNDGTVSLTVHGSGSIDWSGTATVASADDSGSGSIRHQ